MAERIIDLLELVEIDEKYRQLLIPARRFAQAFFQSLDETAAIGKAGQRVVIRQIIEFALRLPALADFAFELGIRSFEFVGARLDLDFKCVAG